LAKEIKTDIPVNAEVEGTGYIRVREYVGRGGVVEKAYEAVITNIVRVDEKQNQNNETSKITF
jgi:hypothetical protein